MTTLPLGPWLPDQPAQREPHCRDARNVLPAADGYEPFRSLVTQGGSLDARCRGAIAARDLDGTIHIYAGDAAKLYERASDQTWTNRSVAGGYTATDTTRWRFASFGDRMLATNGLEAIQYIDMSTGATAFANLPGSPPKARYITAFRDFVLIGNTENSALEVVWSGINDSEGWTSKINQSDRQEFADGGQVNGLAVTDVAYIFQEYAIRRMFYAGPPTIMTIDLIENGRGCIEPGSLAQLGRLMFYLAEDGFYQFNGEQSLPISSEQVDEWFQADIAVSARYRMSSAVDPINKVVAWSYVSRASPSAQPDTILLYNWDARRWAYVRLNCEALFSSLTLGLTLEDLDAIYASVDAMTISLDDPLFAGGTIQFGAFDPAGTLGLFTGSAMEATLETGDFQLNPLGRTRVRSASILTDSTAATIALSARERTGDTAAFGDAVAQRDSGRCPQRSTGRWHRARIVVPAGATWSYLNALQLEAAAAAGMR